MEIAELISCLEEHRGDPTSLLKYHSWASPRHKYLYMSIPKVACTKVKLILQEFEGFRVPDHIGEIHERMNPTQHYVPSLVDLNNNKCCEALNSEKWYRFTFVRNPYHRLFSAYKSKILARDPPYENLLAEMRKAYEYSNGSGKPPGVVAFRDFVHYVCRAPENRMDRHWASQTNLLLLDLINYDFIGRFEHFQRDFSHVLTRLGASAELRERVRSRVNSTPQINHAAAFDRESASWVYEIYRDDFVNFGYDRDSWLLDFET